MARPLVGRRLLDQRGTNLVEAALVIPLLLLVTLAIVDFASLFYVRLALENGVSQATRYDRQNYRIWYQLGFLCMNSGDPEGARAAFVRAKELREWLNVPDLKAK